MHTVATLKQIYSSVNAPAFIPTVLTFEEMCSLLKSILCSSITHYSAGISRFGFITHCSTTSSDQGQEFSVKAAF